MFSITSTVLAHLIDSRLLVKCESRFSFFWLILLAYTIFAFYFVLMNYDFLILRKFTVFRYVSICESTINLGFFNIDFLKIFFYILRPGGGGFMF